MGRPRAVNDPSVRLALTAKQREVLSLIADGKTNAEISERLGVSLDGAKWHVREIFSRLGVDSREDASDWGRNNRGPGASVSRMAAAPGVDSSGVTGCGGDDRRGCGHVRPTG